MTLTRYKTKNFKSIYSRDNCHNIYNYITCELALEIPSWVTFNNNGSEEVVIKDGTNLESFFLQKDIFTSQASLEIFNLSQFDKLSLDNNIGICGSLLTYNDSEKNPLLFRTSNFGLIHRIWLSNDAFRQLLDEINKGILPTEISFFFSESDITNLSKNSLTKEQMPNGLSFARYDEKQLRVVPIVSFGLENKCEGTSLSSNALNSIHIEMGHIRLCLFLIIALLGVIAFV